MNPTKILWGLMALIFTFHIFGPAKCLAAVVPYGQLTPQQKDAYAQRVQQIGLSVDQSMRMLETNYQFKVELPAYTRCQSCGGTGCAQWQTGTVKKQALCTYCNGGGRIQRKVDSSYTYKDPKIQTLGSVQSSVKYETVNCEHCGGTGRINVYACPQCAGNGFVAAGRGVYVVGPTSTAAQKAVAGKAFDLLRLINGKEIRKAQVTKISEGDVELRHSAGMGKYKRNEFVDEDAAKLFGGPQTAGDEALRRAAIIDLTQIRSANDLGKFTVDQSDGRLLSLLMAMKVPLDYGNSPFLVLLTDNGDTNAIAMFLSKGASVDAQDARGRSALRAAVERGAMSLVKEYLARDADPNSKDIKSVTSLHVAAAKDSVELVNCLIDHGARIDSTDAQGRTPYDYAQASRAGKKVAEQMAAQNADYAQAKALIAENKYDEALIVFNRYKDVGGARETILLKGAYLERQGLLQDALELYRQIDSTDDIKRVSSDIQHRQDQLIKARSAENDGRLGDALMAYAKAHALDEVTRMVNIGADINASDVDGWTALTTACVHGNLDVVKCLVDNGADLNTKGLSSTPLIWAVQLGHLDVVEYLIARGADVNAPDKHGTGPLFLAAAGGNIDAVKLLVSNGAEVNAKGPHGKCPLNMAAYAGHLEIVKYLVDKGADVNAMTKDGATAVDFAIDQGHQEVTEFLAQRESGGQEDRQAIPQQTVQNGINPGWYGYGYSSGNVVQAMYLAFHDGGPIPARSEDLESWLRERGIQGLSQNEYASCLAGYMDFMQSKPAKYPVQEDPPRW